MFLKKKTHRNKQFFKKKGFVLVPVVLATFIIGMLGIGLSSLYSGTFGVMNSAKAASQAKQFATVEGDILKVAGYDGSTDVTHDWQSLQNVVGADGANWESKVEDTGRTETSPSGDQVKVMKVSVRKNNELVSRYSEEVPLVNGADTMSRAEIQALINALQGQVDNLTNQLETLNGKVDNIQTQIDAINNQITVINTTISALQKRVEDYHTELLNSIATEKAARESADIAEVDARKAAIDKEVGDRNAAIKASTDSLNSRINVLDGQIKDLYNKVNNNSNSIIANTKNISANTNAINDIRQTMTKLRETIDTNSGSISTIKSRLDGNEFVKQGGVEKSHNNGISLSYNPSDRKLHAYYNGSEVTLGAQGGAFSKEIISDGEKELRAYVIRDEVTSGSVQDFDHGYVDVIYYVDKIELWQYNHIGNIYKLYYPGTSIVLAQVDDTKKIDYKLIAEHGFQSNDAVFDDRSEITEEVIEELASKLGWGDHFNNCEIINRF